MHYPFSKSTYRYQVVALIALAFVFCTKLQAQTQKITLDDLSSFLKPSKSWQIVGDVTASLEESNQLTTQKGTGVLANLPTQKRKGKDLYTNFEHGDIDLSLEYMMAKGSNSGIYLQGMYEIQLLDSWGKKSPTSGDNAGIYQRWDENKPDGEKGYEGYPARQNVTKAPGLWQQMRISFRAPRFDDMGNKIENARMLLVELNGVTVHEDVELLGPTRGAMKTEEVARGPIRIQGDHGAVAFRNLKYTLFDNPVPALTNLEYSVYEGEFEEEPDYSSIEADLQGESATLTANLGTSATQFLVRYTGNIEVQKPGEYTFNLNAPGGGATLSIDEENVLERVINGGSNTVQLEAGTHPLSLAYSKYVSWVNPVIGLQVEGPGVRQTIISNQEDLQRSRVQDPIIRNAGQPTTHRSFMRLANGEVVTHAISVGSPNDLHYTYDLNHGTIVQAWRGGFLDATPMWYNRGNGTAKPLGAIQHLNGLGLTVAGMSNNTWQSDTTGTGFTPKGYLMDTNDQPTFRFQVNGVMIHDKVRVADNGKGLTREISAQQPASNLYVKLAEGSSIEAMGDGTYAVDGKSYYLKLNDSVANPTISEADGMQLLVAPLQDKIAYTILF